MPVLAQSSANASPGVGAQLQTVSLRTVGCRLNQAESGMLAAQFRAAGYRVLPEPEVGAIAVVHSCAITRQAERSSLQLARRLRRRGARIVVVAGCAVEHAAARVDAQAAADLVVGQAEKFRIPALLAARGITPPPHACPAGSYNPRHTPEFTQTRALVKVQDGCDFHCAYCIVPSTRGAPTSRPLADILAEARQQVDRGYREIVLTGANMGCYADGPHRLADVLIALANLAGLDRIRLSSLEVSTSERDILDVMAASSKICRFLHLPLQSGDDTVLARMGRRYTAAAYTAFVMEAAQRLPGLGLGADVIVGLPGEDEPAFRRTMALVERLPFSNLHVFAYSQREGTRAATMPHQVTAADKKHRSDKLLALGAAKRHAFARSWVGRPVQVLVERHDPAGNACGWTAEYLPARIGQPAPVNAIVTVTPDATDGETLLASASG
jgi:threonylcarbamoyladenosine tRNA methylthiotransferase MtaB